MIFNFLYLTATCLLSHDNLRIYMLYKQHFVFLWLKSSSLCFPLLMDISDLLPCLAILHSAAVFLNLYVYFPSYSFLQIHAKEWIARSW